MLKARLYNMKLKKRKKIKELNSKTDIGWGHQISLCFATLSISQRFKK